MQRYALAFTVKPGTEQQVADILTSYGRPVTEIDENTRLLGTTRVHAGQPRHSGRLTSRASCPR